MKNKIMFLGAMLLLVMVTSCREESDAVQNYAFNDGLAFEEAKESYAGKFKVMWKALDQNYGIWDYERSLGLDWDAVYDEFLPMLYMTSSCPSMRPSTSVTTSQMTNSGNCSKKPWHPCTMATLSHRWKTTRRAAPSWLIPAAHATSSAMTMRLWRIPHTICQPISPLSMAALATRFWSTKMPILNSQVSSWWAKAHVNDPALEDYQKHALQDFVKDFDNLYNQLVNGLDMETGSLMYDELLAANQHLEIPGLIPSDAFGNYAVSAKYALFKNNIAYFFFSGFYLTPYLDDEYFKAIFGGKDAVTQLLALTVRQAWKAWFDKVQELHASGQLKGVIIDVRNNGGGMLNDFQYVLGSMLPSGQAWLGPLRLLAAVTL